MSAIGLQLVTEQDLGGLSSKRCSHSNPSLAPRSSGKLTVCLGRVTLSQSEKEEVRALIDAIMRGELSGVEKLVRTYANQISKFLTVRNAVAAILPIVSDGCVEVLTTTPYRMPLMSGKIVEVINLTVRQTGSCYAVGIPTHQSLASESFKSQSFQDGTLLFEPDRAYEPRQIMRQIARATSMKAVTPPPMVAGH